MSGYPPPGPPPYYGHYPPPPPPLHPPHPYPHHPPHPSPYHHPPHLPPGSFTYLPQAYSYDPSPPQWQQPSTTQPYVQPTQPTLPTYEVNVVQQPTVVAEPAPEPVITPAEDVISWIPATPTTAQPLEYKAVVGGKEGYDGSPLWVIRAHHKGELIPGKLAIKHRYAFIPSAGMEVPVHNFEILCATNPAAIQWVPARDGQVPASAIAAGNTLNADPLYIGKVPHKWSVTPGKVQPNQGCCYISYGGKEISFKKYEVLCQVQ